MPWSVCQQTFEKLDQNTCLKWLKAANKWFKRCHKVLVCRPVLRCSNLQFFFSTEDDPVHFARTLLTVTLKQIHHFKCKRSETAAAITMSTDCNLQISLSWIAFAFIFERTRLFFRNTDPYDVSFLKKQPRVSAICFNCSQESPQAHFFFDISSNWRQFSLVWEQLLCF